MSASRANWRGLLAHCLRPSDEAGAILPSPPGRRWPGRPDEGPGPTMSHVLGGRSMLEADPLIRPFGAPSPGGRRESGSASSATHGKPRECPQDRIGAGGRASNLIRGREEAVSLPGWADGFWRSAANRGGFGRDDPGEGAAPSQLSEDRGVGGGSKVGENGGAHAFGERSPPFPSSLKSLHSTYPNIATEGVRLRPPRLLADRQNPRVVDKVIQRPVLASNSSWVAGANPAPRGGHRCRGTLRLCPGHPVRIPTFE